MLAGMSGLVARWIAVRGAVADTAALARALDAAVTRGRRAWPTVTLAPEAFADRLAALAPDDVDPVPAIASLRVEELYLATACLLGDGAAIAELEHKLMPAATRGAAVLVAADAAEIAQHVRGRLLVAEPGRRPALAQYAGRGSLEGWIRVAAARAALNLLRGRRRDERTRDAAAALEVEDLGPELRLVKERFREPMREATQRAFAALPDDHRELLRLHVLDGLSLDELGRLHDVHASTVSRWLARIRDKIAADTRRYFAERCGLPPGECDTLVRAVQSDLELSVERLLGDG
jgi:RNA polymerase sigma-70 factor (ECF subfamily)